MLHKFNISNLYDVHVHLTEAEATQDVDITTAFVLSLEDIHNGLHCDHIKDCNICPIEQLCTSTNNLLPDTIIHLFAPQLIIDYPEYFI